MELELGGGGPLVHRAGVAVGWGWGWGFDGRKVGGGRSRRLLLLLGSRCSTVVVGRPGGGVEVVVVVVADVGGRRRGRACSRGLKSKRCRTPSGLGGGVGVDVDEGRVRRGGPRDGRSSLDKRLVGEVEVVEEV